MYFELLTSINKAYDYVVEQIGENNEFAVRSGLYHPVYAKEIESVYVERVGVNNSAKLLITRMKGGQTVTLTMFDAGALLGLLDRIDERNKQQNINQ